MELGVHDLITYNADETPEQAYRRTQEFVKDIEKLNYKRYWFAEHHNSQNHGSISPELLVANMVGQTTKLRLGTGGTMIMHYSPLKIAENFKTLAALAPDRIDFGIGRAPGSGPNEIIALAQGRPINDADMYEKIEVILNYLTDQDNPGYYGRTQAMPTGIESLPQAWMLGSSGQSALKTAEMGLGYSFAKFFGMKTDPQVFQLYRDHFQASQFFQTAQIMVSYLIIVADTEDEADYLAKPIEMAQLALNQNKIIQNMNPEQVKDYQYSSEEQAIIKHKYQERFLIKGTQAQVESILAEEIERLKFDELIVYAPIFDDQARLKSYQLLAEMFDKI